MEIYSSSTEPTRTTNDTPIYRSRARLLTGAIVWAAITLFFALLAWRAHTETTKLVFSLFLVGFAVWQVLRCLKSAFGPETPALIFSRTGLQLPDGTVVAWNNIIENRFISKGYLGISYAQRIQLKISQPKKSIVVPASSLPINGDKYFALCDRYQAAN